MIKNYITLQTGTNTLQRQGCEFSIKWQNFDCIHDNPLQKLVFTLIKQLNNLLQNTFSQFKRGGDKHDHG